MKMSKLICALLALLTVLGCLISCGGGQDATETEQTTETAATETEEETKRLDEYGREYIEDDIPEDLTFKGAADNTVTFFAREAGVYALEMDCDELKEDTLNDAIYYRNVTVEERLGVTITQILQPWDSTTWNQTLRNAVLNRTGDYDAAAIYASQSSAMATEGVYLNVNELNYLNTDKPWWNQKAVSELELYGALYFLGGDIAITEVLNAGLIAFNKTLLEKYHPGVSLYEVVDNFDWTVDKLYELSSVVHEDLNTSGQIDDGDVIGITHWSCNSQNSGFMDLWLPAVGVAMTTPNSEGIPEITIYNDRSVLGFEKLKKLCTENPGGVPKTGLKQTTFVNGMALFSTNTPTHCEALREMKDAYGVLPLPMLNKEQGFYATYAQNACSLIVVCSGCPEERQDMIGATLELMAAESYRKVIPEYMEVCLRSKYSESPDDARMYDLVVDGITIDFGFVFSTKSIAGVGSLFRDLGADFVQAYEANKETYQTALEKLLGQLQEISPNS